MAQALDPQFESRSTCGVVVVVVVVVVFVVVVLAYAVDVMRTVARSSAKAANCANPGNRRYRSRIPSVSAKETSVSLGKTSVLSRTPMNGGGEEYEE